MGPTRRAAVFGGRPASCRPFPPTANATTTSREPARTCGSSLERRSSAMRAARMGFLSCARHAHSALVSTTPPTITSARRRSSESFGFERVPADDSADASLLQVGRSPAELRFVRKRIASVKPCDAEASQGLRVYG